MYILYIRITEIKII